MEIEITETEQIRVYIRESTHPEIQPEFFVETEEKKDDPFNPLGIKYKHDIYGETDQEMTLDECYNSRSCIDIDELHDNATNSIHKHWTEKNEIRDPAAAQMKIEDCKSIVRNSGTQTQEGSCNEESMSTGESQFSKPHTTSIITQYQGQLIQEDVSTSTSFHRREVVRIDRLPSDLQKLFICEYCQTCFSHKSDFDLHKQLSSLETNPLVKVSASNTNCKTSLLYAYGHSTFSYQNELIPLSKPRTFRADKPSVNEHEEIANTNEKPFYTCHECGKNFESKSTLLRHIKNHELPDEFNVERRENIRRNEKLTSDFGLIRNPPFICATCNQVFEFLIDLIVHMKCHLSDTDTMKKSGLCPECGKQVRDNYALRRHLGVHTGEKFYKCTDKSIIKVHKCQKIASTLSAHLSGGAVLGMIPNGQSSIAEKEIIRNGKKCTLSEGEKYVRPSLETRTPALPASESSATLNPLSGVIQNGSTNRKKQVDSCRIRMLQFVNDSNYIKTGKKPFSCDLCEKLFEFEADLIIHVASHALEIDPTKLRECPLCGRKVSRSQKLRYHVATHTGEHYYKCNQCSYTCIQNTSMVSHKLFNHAKGLVFECQKCHATIYDYGPFLQHQKLHLKNENTRSSVKNENTRSSVQLIEDQHSEAELFAEEVQVKPVNTSRNNFNVCPLCLAKFSTKLNLDEHVELKHGLKCKICCKVFTKRRDLTRHSARQHPSPTKRKNYFCAHCDAAFTLKRPLKRHMQSAHGFRQAEKVKCKLCGIEILRTSIYSHNVTHHSEKQYVCEECGAAFARSDYLRKHMFKHNKERAHLCSYCAAKFSRKDNLKVHERKHALLGDQMKPKPPAWKRC